MRFLGIISGADYGYVYIMSYPKSNKLKIGHSLNPTTRAADIGGTLSPEAPTLEAYFWCSERRGDVERQAHKILKEFRSKGEWFSVSMDDAVKAIKQASMNTSVEIQQVFRNKKSSGYKDYGYDMDHIKNSEKDRN